MLRYCTILPHAPLPCAAIMACRGIAPFYPTLLPCAAIMPCRAIAPFYPTLLSLVLLLWHAEVLHHSTPRSSLVLLFCHAEVLHHSTPRSSPLCCYYGMPRYCTILPHAPPLCCYYAMSRYCTILPHAPLPCAAIMACRGIAQFYSTLLSLVPLLWHAEVLHHSTPRSSPLCCYNAMSSYCTILPHAPLPCAAIMPCRGIAPFYSKLLSLVPLLWHAEVLHHSTPRSSPLCCYYAMPRYCTILPTLLSLVLQLCHAEVLLHSTPRSPPLCCYYAMPRYCTILPHAPLPCAAIMPCRGIAPFYPTLLSLVLLLCHAELLLHSTPRSSPLCCYYAVPRYCTILPHAPLPCAAIMACRCIAPFYPTLLSLVLLLCHVEVLHHSTPRCSPLCCYYGMPRYCTILPHAPLPCAAIMPCRAIAPFYPTPLSLVLLLWHAEVLHHSTPRSSLVLLLCHVELLHHSTPRSSPLYCYYAMPRYCTILPHAPLPCAAIMACRGIVPFYLTLLSLVLLLWHADVLHHSIPRSSPLCCYYAMPRYCTILHHAPLPCAAIMPCRGIAPFYPCSTRVLLLWHAEVLHNSTPRSSRVLLLCHAEVLHHSTHAPLPCAAIMPCRGIAPFYPTLLSLVLLLCHAEVLHHSTHAPPVCCYYGMPRYCIILPHAPPVCCYYAMPSYCTILPHAPLPCAVIMACRGIAPFYPTLISLVLLLWHAEVLHHSTPRASPLCCYYGMPLYCTILPHAPLPCAAVMPCRGIAPFYPTLLPCAAIMPCRAIAPFYPTLLSLVLLLWHAEVLHHSTPRSSRVLLVWHAEVLHHSTPRSSPLCCYYGMPRYCTILPHAPPLCCYYAMSSYCTILPHAPLPCAAIMACRGFAPFYPTLLPCAASMAC